MRRPQAAAAPSVKAITGSFGIPVEQALDLRAALRNPAEVVAMIAPIVAARREAPEDDLISVLVEAEYTDEDGVSHRLTDAEILSFSMLLMAAVPSLLPQRRFVLTESMPKTWAPVSLDSNDSRIACAASRASM